MRIIYGMCAVALLVGCTSISVTETNDKKGNYVALVKVSEFAIVDIEPFLDEAGTKMKDICSTLKELHDFPMEAATAVPELQAWLGLVATARGLLATHEYVRPCVLEQADVGESDAQEPGL